MVIPEKGITFAKELRNRSTNNLNQLKVMGFNDYDIQLKTRVMETMEALDKAGCAGFISKFSDGFDKVFKPAFSVITEILQESNLIPPSYKADSIWYTDGSSCSWDEPINHSYFIIKAYNRNYDCKSCASKTFKGDNLIFIPSSVTSQILDVMDNIITNIEKLEQEAKETLSANEMEQIMLSYFNKHIDKEYYKIGTETGRLNYQGNDVKYQCLVVREIKSNGYVASIVISKDKMGNYHLCNRVPLCGESTRAFDVNSAEECAKDTLKFLNACA